MSFGKSPRPPRPSLVRESAIEAKFVRLIKGARGLALKFKSPERASVPDRIVLMPGGYVCFVELKAPGKKPTAAQEREHCRLRDLGFQVYVVDSEHEADRVRKLIRWDSKMSELCVSQHNEKLDRQLRTDDSDRRVSQW